MVTEFKYIFEGWKNYAKAQLGVLEPEIEKEAREKIAVCAACSWLVKGSDISKENQTLVTKALPDDYFCNPDKSKIIDGKKVQGCSCPIIQKGYSHSTCPQNKFENER